MHGPACQAIFGVDSEAFTCDHDWGVERIVHVTQRQMKKFWEKKLQKAGLGMDAGRDPGHRKLTYIGSGADVDALNEQLVGKRSGRVKPKGHGPDQFEAGSDGFNNRPQWERS